MVVTTILGGMGNQLRSYATAYAVAVYLEQPLVLDVSDYFGGYFRPYVLDLLSIPEHLKIYYPQKKPIYNVPDGAPTQFLNKFDCFIDTDAIRDRKELLAAVEGKQNIWLMGYGKLSFCTEEEREELKNLFQPIRKSRFLCGFIEKAEAEESVAIHIRRTDFIDGKWAGDETLDYYQAAINYLKQEVHASEFYFFSDDIEWAKKALGYCENYHYIHCFGGRESGLEELFCMAACKHHILTDRSTFGAWAVFLSRQKDGINIANGKLDLDGIADILVMDRSMIETYWRNYQADYGMSEKIIPWNELEGMLQADNNVPVIEYIDKISMDAYSILPEMRERLMELKGIAHIQNNDVETALSVFDDLQQTQRDTFDLSINYSVVLENAGRHMESLLYLGNALRINEAAVPDRLKEVKGEWDGEIVRLVREQEKRHYILVNSPCAYAKAVKGFYESIAIMLRNMGNTVTIVEIVDVLTLDIEWEQIVKTAILNYMQSTMEKQDRVYNWDIDKYRFYIMTTQDGKSVTLSDFLPRLAEKKEEVVLLTHSIEGIRNAPDGYPLIFLDAISEWDVQKDVLGEYSKAEWNEIYRSVSKIITDRELPAQWADKKVSPFGLGKGANRVSADEIIFKEDRITILEHYMRNEESLCGMLSVLKAVEEVDIV